MHAERHNIEKVQIECQDTSGIEIGLARVAWGTKRPYLGPLLHGEGGWGDNLRDEVTICPVHVR